MKKATRLKNRSNLEQLRGEHRIEVARRDKLRSRLAGFNDPNTGIARTLFPPGTPDRRNLEKRFKRQLTKSLRYKEKLVGVATERLRELEIREAERATAAGDLDRANEHLIAARAL